MSGAECSQCLTIPSERENICCKKKKNNNIAWHIGILVVKYLHMGHMHAQQTCRTHDCTRRLLLDERTRMRALYQ